jgi:hypothetical protein
MTAIFAEREECYEGALLALGLGLGIYQDGV